jgi:predicted enzyme related to lactoylglutathione lyase
VRVAFTKLVVRDLQAQAAFYRAVCGFGEGINVKSTVAGRGLEEIIFRNAQGGTDLILFKWTEGAEPDPSGVIAGFYTPDLEAIEARILAAGGKVLAPIKEIVAGAGKLRLAFYTDPEGYVLELLEG